MHPTRARKSDGSRCGESASGLPVCHPANKALDRAALPAILIPGVFHARSTLCPDARHPATADAH